MARRSQGLLRTCASTAATNRPSVWVGAALLAAIGLVACGDDPVAFPEAVRSSDLVEDLPCTNSFRRVSEDGSLMLEVRWTGEFLESPSQQVPERTVDLPDANWTATFKVGAHLELDWCTDVFGPDDGFPEVAFEAEVSGDLVIHTLPDDEGGPATATLRNVEIDHPDNSVSRLGSVSLSNEQFAFLAG